MNSQIQQTAIPKKNDATKYPNKPPSLDVMRLKTKKIKERKLKPICSEKMACLPVSVCGVRERVYTRPTMRGCLDSQDL